MIRRIVLVILVMLSFSVGTLSLIARAQTVESDLIGLGMQPEQASYVAGIIPGGSALGNNTALKARNQAGSADIAVLKVDTTDDTVLNANSGELVKVSVALTPVIQVAAAGVSSDIPMVAGYALRPVPYTVTLAATPVAGSNDFKVGVNIAPTAVANTAALMPTPSAVGQQLTVINTGGNAVRVKPGGTNTINGGAAGAYIPLAAAQVVHCSATTTSAWYCWYGAVPTPAGP